jgi:dihydroorotate dehydrogenase
MRDLYDSLLRRLLFSLPPETAHHMALTALKIAARPRFRAALRRRYRVSDPALRTSIRGVSFPNPVGLAAGFDKNAEALQGLAALGFGFLEAGTLTPRPQPGNPLPRIWRLPQDRALVNRLGFNNAGAAAAAHRFSDAACCAEPGPVPSPLGLDILLGINIGKNKDTPPDVAASDYVFCLELLHPWAQFFVVNVSSPNTPGLRALQAPRDLEALLSAVGKKNEELAQDAAGVHKPLLFVKVSPDEVHGEETVEIALRCGFDGIVATNTTLSREGLSGPAPSEGGLSGRPLRARSTDMIRRLFRAARGRLALIGVGGIFSAEDAYEKILAGASLVEVYTGFIYQGPATARAINQGLLRLLKRDGFSSIEEAVGKGA